MFNLNLRKEKGEINTQKSAVISVWGSPSSGKTTVSVKLAKAIAEKKIKVVLVLCNNSVPMLPCIIPPSEIDDKKSLGNLLSNVNLDETMVKKHLATIKRSEYITILGTKKGENENTYIPYSHIQVEELIDTLKEISKVIIFDCTTEISSNLLSQIAIENSDFILNLVNCDLKSISFLSSQLSQIYQKGVDEYAIYKVLSNVKPQHSTEQMNMAIGKTAFQIPYSEEVEEQFLNGDIFEDLSFKNSRNFRKEINKIVNEILDV